jgi:hypothetical protein
MTLKLSETTVYLLKKVFDIELIYFQFYQFLWSTKKFKLFQN